MRAVLLALALIVAGPAWAVLPDEMLDDPALEARARAISKQIRCLVCRNENIDDSNADLARDLRILIRERLVAGDSDAQVVAFLVERYGEYVLLKPPMRGANIVLWLAGPLLLAGGGWIAWRVVRRQGAAAPEEAAPLSEEERARLAELAGED